VRRRDLLGPINGGSGTARGRVRADGRQRLVEFVDRRRHDDGIGDVE
jgi:hypothetical protein